MTVSADHRGCGCSTEGLCHQGLVIPWAYTQSIFPLSEEGPPWPSSALAAHPDCSSGKTLLGIHGDTPVFSEGSTQAGALPAPRLACRFTITSEHHPGIQNDFFPPSELHQHECRFRNLRSGRKKCEFPANSLLSNKEQPMLWMKEELHSSAWHSPILSMDNIQVITKPGWFSLVPVQAGRESWVLSQRRR